MIDLQKIQDAKHIVIKCDKDSFANANALYSFVLFLHKKVSLVSEQEIQKCFSFLPWFEKLRSATPGSADYTLIAPSDVVVLVEFFTSNSIKINKKMATALYSALLLEYDNFTSKSCNGITFALASKLIELGAEHKLCMREIYQSEPLRLFRLRAILFAAMQLKDNARCATLFISQEILDSCGAQMQDVYLIMKETLKLVNVESVELLDNNNEIIKLIKDV
ncbi:DHH family phosphoesterase [Sulfurimonas sp.]